MQTPPLRVPLVCGMRLLGRLLPPSDLRLPKNECMLDIEQELTTIVLHLISRQKVLW